MNNADAGAALREIAELLELRGESSFRIRAYENASNALTGTTEDVNVLANDHRLVALKGVGKGIADRIEELLTTGHIAYLEELQQEFPAGVRSLLKVPGIGPALARRVYRELGIDSLDSMREAAEDGRLASLSGMGQKSADNVIRALSRVSKEDNRISIGKALPLVEHVMGQLRDATPVQEVLPAGSLRRWSPTIGDIDLIATTDGPAAVMDAFVTLPDVQQVLGRGPTKSSIISGNGLQVDLRIVEAESFGSLLQHFTGSRDHNIELREYALQRGVSLNEYGIVTVADQTLHRYQDEISFYAALDLEYIPPELRQGSGEIRAAKARALPTLIDVGDIRGDMHMHSEWSDGSVPIEEMIAAAQARGYEYVALTDHSGGIGVANGLSAERLLQQIQEVRVLAARFPGIRIFAGSEVDIKRDGSLDFPDEILAQLDWVIASVHSGFNQPRDEMTARIIAALENPHVNLLAHPTGRLIGKRAAYDVDLEAVFRAAARTNTALEINSFPERLDLVDTHVRRAKELGAMIVINTDAHAPAHFDNIRYGVAMARRGWLEAGDVLNALPLESLEKRLRSVSR
ncbi:MAG: DNA polymerase/3'-5' exonuclease PolX [Chloroflexota bacterium]